MPTETDPEHSDRARGTVCQRTLATSAKGPPLSPSADVKVRASAPGAGRLLETPSCNLLGGRFRDRIRFYRTMLAVDKPEDQPRDTPRSPGVFDGRPRQVT